MNVSTLSHRIILLFILEALTVNFVFVATWHVLICVFFTKYLANIKTEKSFIVASR